MKDPVTGKWRTIEKSGFKTIADAKAAMAAKKLEVVENPESVLVKDKPITLTEVYKEFIEKYASMIESNQPSEDMIPFLETIWSQNGETGKLAAYRLQKCLNICLQ